MTAVFKHFPVNAENRFLATKHPGLHAPLGQPCLHGLENFIDHLAPVSPRSNDGFAQCGVAQGVEVLEAEFLQVAVDFVEPEPVGDGRVDFKGFTADAPAFCRCHDAQGFHVVQPV